MKHVALPVVLALVCVSALLGTISAYAQNQSGTLEMLMGDPIIEPESSLSFTPLFVPETGTQYIYNVLDPVQPDSRLGIYDSLTTDGFTVTATISDLASPDGHDIDYRHISIVTLSESGTGVDTAPYNNPPGAPHVTTPASCNSWQSASGDTLATMESKCGAIMDTAASRFYELTPSSSLLTATIDPTIVPASTTIQVADGLVFNLQPVDAPYNKVRIGNDLMTYTGIEGDTLTGVTGIDETHFPGALVIRHPLESGPLTLMENTSAGDTGLYSVGLSLRLVIDSSFKQGDYSGTLTITYIPQWPHDK